MTCRRARFGFLVVGLALVLGARASVAQGPEWIKANYTKYEYQIPMRDGVKLFTSVLVPKDMSKPHPIMLNRTPYDVAPYGVDKTPNNLLPSPAFGTAGYIFADQDVRGRWMSEGEFVNMRPIRADKGSGIDESTDTYDTIDWLVKNIPNNNGRVGQWGISYPGFYTASGLVDAHPALKAASPQAPVIDWFVGDDFHRNGVFWLPHAFNFLANFGKPRPSPIKTAPDKPFDHGTPDGYEFFLDLGALPNAESRYLKRNVAFWTELMQHGSYDAFWKARNLRPHLKAVKPAVLTVGGWFDAENLFGALQCYKSIEASTPGATNTLVMGPWFHGQWGSLRDPGEKMGNARFDAKTAEFYRESIIFPFFEHYLQGKPDPKLPEAMVFQTGTNQWQRLDAWPPKSAQPKSVYLQSGGKLAMEASPSSDQDFDEYISDPAHPVPYTASIAIGMTREYMTDDQRFAARRPDVLVYQTDILTADMTLAGPITADLKVSTSGTDSDWVVKVIDVYPNDYPEPADNPAGPKMAGYQQLVRGEMIRGKFRESLENPTPFEPDQPTTVKFRLNDVYHTFRPGHKMMVQIQSSWFPLADRNPQKFEDIYQAKDEDFQKATQRVYHGPGQVSKLDVLVQP